MLAYVFWHRPREGTAVEAYELALERFHRSLAHRPPSGFRGSAAFRAAELPWLAPTQGQQARAAGGGYEDWYLLDGWGALGVLEEAAVSRGHISAHDAAAGLAGAGTAGIYRLSEGHENLADTRVSVWVTSSPGHSSPAMADLLQDGMDPRRTCLWRRGLALGPAPEFCLLASEPEAVGALTGVAATRLPAGWTAMTFEREVLWSG